jgi:hypoxanthine phosphoribosyltransferase
MIFSLSNNYVKCNGGANCVLAIYAPNSAITISGGGFFAGAMVGKSLQLNGNVEVHYDEALKKTPTKNYWINSWQEL